jgi:hypothetical protein
VLDYDLASRPQRATLEEVPLPREDSERIVFWVDDSPEDNAALAAALAEKGV